MKHSKHLAGWGRRTFLAMAIISALLWLSGLAIWNVYGNDDPEARLWSIVMFVQSGPFVASLLPAAMDLTAGPTAALVPSAAFERCSGDAAPRKPLHVWGNVRIVR